MALSSMGSGSSQQTRSASQLGSDLWSPAPSNQATPSSANMIASASSPPSTMTTFNLLQTAAEGDTGSGGDFLAALKVVAPAPWGNTAVVGGGTAGPQRGGGGMGSSDRTPPSDPRMAAAPTLPPVMERQGSNPQKLTCESSMVHVQ